MEKQVFIDLKDNTVIFNKETEDIAITGDRNPKPASGVTSDSSVKIVGGFDGRPVAPINIEDHDKWFLVDDDAPGSIKLKIVLMRLTMLEDFVFSRLK
jgi:hypothetical protein